MKRSHLSSSVMDAIFNIGFWLIEVILFLIVWNILMPKLFELPYINLIEAAGLKLLIEFAVPLNNDKES